MTENALTRDATTTGRGGVRASTPRSILVLVAFLLISYAVAAFGTLSTIENVDGWYADAQKAAWSPPNSLFGPVWGLLYTLMAVAAWLVLRHRTENPRVRRGLTLYVVQLVLNCLWTPIFFGAYPGWGHAALWIGLVVILLLDVAVALTMTTFFRVSRLAGWFLVPYLAWIVFATSLNWALAALNS